MKNKRLLLFPAAVVLVLTAFIGSAVAYFTTYAQAKGGYTIQLQDQWKPHEEFSNWTKHLQIESVGDVDCWVRAKAFAPSWAGELEYGGAGWTLGEDGWYYYDSILYAGETTPELTIKINNIPEELTVTDFDVDVVYECTPVLYDEAGNPYADWVNDGRAEGGN